MPTENFEMKSAARSKNDLLACMIQEMMQAETVQERRIKAFDAILKYRRIAPRISDEEIYQIHQELRDSVFVD